MRGFFDTFRAPENGDATKMKKAKTITAIAAALTLAMIAAQAHAQTGAQTNPGPKRQFDLVTGIYFSCRPAAGFAWTVEACGPITADFKKRAAALKLPFADAPVTGDISTKKLETVQDFNLDKAVRAVWSFDEDKAVKGRISAGITAHRVWEPTPKEIPNAVPGQRIPVLFVTQSVLFDPGVKLKDAQPYLTMVTDTFFEAGEMKR